MAVYIFLTRLNNIKLSNIIRYNINEKKSLSKQNLNLCYFSH